MEPPVQYAGFWRRVAASLIDTLLLLIILLPLGYLLFGADYLRAADPAAATDPAAIDSGRLLLENVLPAVIIIFFWVRYGGTPGKRLMSCCVVDMATGKPPTVSRAIVRYLGYIVSTLPLLLGFLWIAWDRRKQGFHDKMARTVVVVDRGYAGDDESRKPLEQLVKEAS